MNSNAHKLLFAAIFCGGILSTVATGGGGGGDSVGEILDDTLATPMHTSVAAADLNSDGLIDAVSVSNTLDPEGIRVNVFFQEGGAAGSFAGKVEYLIGVHASLRSQHIVVDDLDLDAAPDIIISHLGISTSGGNPPGTKISILLQDPAATGRFLPHVSYDVGNLAYGIAVGDLDLDGLPDLVTATGDGLYLLLQDGSNLGTFLPATRVTNSHTEIVRIGDLNNDGLLDLAFDENQRIRILLNDPGGIGGFISGPLLNVGGGPADFVLQDLDGDERLDVSVAIFRSSANVDHGSVSVLLQDPSIDTEFSGFTEYIVEQAFNVRSIAVADLDGDEHPDIVSAIDASQGNNAKVVVLRQAPAGVGTFTSAVGYSHSGINDPFMVVVANLGPDSLPDLLLANALDGIYALYQDPSGTATFNTSVKIGE